MQPDLHLHDAGAALDTGQVQSVPEAVVVRALRRWTLVGAVLQRAQFTLAGPVEVDLVQLSLLYGRVGGVVHQVVNASILIEVEDGAGDGDVLPAVGGIGGDVQHEAAQVPAALSAIQPLAELLLDVLTQQAVAHDGHPPVQLLHGHLGVIEGLLQVQLDVRCYFEVGSHQFIMLMSCMVSCVLNPISVLPSPCLNAVYRSDICTIMCSMVAGNCKVSLMVCTRLGTAR